MAALPLPLERSFSNHLLRRMNALRIAEMKVVLAACACEWAETPFVDLQGAWKRVSAWDYRPFMVQSHLICVEGHSQS